ncbi:MAG: response regulator [Myxococcales bacterium]|nr:response regulator [Myxococcales bacterium]
MSDDRVQLLREIDSLRRQLAEAQETISAIQAGDVDAVVTDTEQPRVLTLDAADRPYRLLVERMNQGAATLTIEGTVLYCNEQFAWLVRHPQGSLIGRPIQDVIDEPFMPLFEAMIGDGLAASVEGEVILRRGDGMRVPVFLGVSGLHEGIAGPCLLLVDLTELKRRERLVADEALARSILEQVIDAVIVCDSDGKVLRASRAAYELCGQNPILKPFDQMFELVRLRPDNVAGERVDVGAAWRGEMLRGWEVGLERPDGRRELLLGAGPLVAAGGEVLGAVITLTDITPMRDAQDELERRATALQEADQRKDEFLAMLAHELRNPLSPIRSSLEIMHLRMLDDPMMRRCRDIIERQVQQLTRMVDDLLEVSRINSGKIQLQVDRVDLSAAVTRGLETIRPVVDAKKHRLALSLPNAPVWVRADLTRVAQVIGNIVHNAAKYTEDSGVISVKIRQEGDEGVVRVRDTGIGIPVEMLTKVFDLFTQANRSLDRSQGGLGIGLALVKRLVAMHGGRVEAFSEGVGRGSEFVVCLPLWHGDRQGTVAQAGGARGDGGRGRRVLVVDDNQDAVDVLASLLGMLGHTVRTANDGRAAISAATEFRPDVVLCDIGLPLMDGYAVVAALRGLPGFEDTQFVALTGYGREEDRRRSLAAGFHAHLVKPFELAKLEAVLERTGRAGVSAGG